MMKKYLLLAMAFASTTALANTQANTNATTTKEAKQPIMGLTTIDVGGKVAKSLNSTVYSLSKANTTQLCWEVINIPFTAKNKVTEVFTTPAKSKFTHPDASVTTSNEDKTHTIVSHIPSVNNEFIRKCWKFDKTDPIGNYTLDLRVNDIIFPTQKFSIVK